MKLEKKNRNGKKKYKLEIKFTFKKKHWQTIKKNHQKKLHNTFLLDN